MNVCGLWYYSSVLVLVLIRTVLYVAPAAMKKAQSERKHGMSP
jgi:hypothetical protein